MTIILPVLLVLCVAWALYERRRYIVTEVEVIRAAAELKSAQLETDAAHSAWVASKADADRLAAIVREYIRICDETAVLLKDEQPPAMTNERQALSEHEKLVQARSNSS